MPAKSELPADLVRCLPTEVIRSGDLTIVRDRSGRCAIPNVVQLSVPMIMTVALGHRTLAWGPHEVSVGAGQAVFATPGAYRIWTQADPGDALWIFFEPEFIAAFLQRHPALLSTGSATVESRAFPVRLTPFLVASMESLPLFLASSIRPSPPLIEHKLDEIVLSLMDADPRVVPQLRYAARQERSLLRYVETQQASRRSLNELARGAGQSLSTFKRRFRDAAGAPPAAWLRRRRLDRALLLLETTNRSVTDVAFDVGFASVSHFVQAFRRQHGSTPRGVRKTKSQGAA